MMLTLLTLSEIHLRFVRGDVDTLQKGEGDYASADPEDSEGSFLNDAHKDPKADYIIANVALMKRFDGAVKRSFEKIRGNQLKIRTLEKRRDTLLQKLISGQIRVS